MAVPSLHSIWKCYCELRTRVSLLENANTVTVDQSQLVTGNLTGDGNANGVLLTMNNRLIEGDWQNAGPNAVRKTTASDFVEIDAMAFYQQATTAAEQRISPSLEVLVDGVVVQTSATGYQRHTNAHHNSSNTVAITVKNVPANALVQVRARRGNVAEPGVVPITLGTFSVRAVNRVNVVSG